MQVLAKHGGIQRLALEAAPQEERAASPQQRAHDRKIQVGAGGSVRRRQALRVDEVRQQQVVEVAAMVGQIDEPLARRDFGELVGVLDLDRVVQPSKEPLEHELDRAHDRIAEVRRDLPRELARLVLGRRDRYAEPPGLLGDRLLQLLRRDHRADQVAPVRQVRSDRRFAHPPKMEAQEAIGLAHRRRFVGLTVDQPAQRDRLAEVDARLPAVQQDDRKLSQRTYARPGVGEERLERANPASPATAPQSTVTGTSWMSSAGSRSSAAVICESATDGSAVRVLSGLRLRITENTARSAAGNSGPIGASAEGKPSRSASSSSTSRLDSRRS